VREFRSHGSVRGAVRDDRPYREHQSQTTDCLSFSNANFLCTSKHALQLCSRLACKPQPLAKRPV
jgi:hypothetical protein